MNDVWKTLNKWLPPNIEKVGQDDEWRKCTQYRGYEKWGQPPLGLQQGSLTLVGYHDDDEYPLRVQCVCGRQVNMAYDDFMSTRHCGCYYDVVRAFHLIRMRWEMLRFFLTNTEGWFEDMRILQDHIKALDGVPKTLHHRSLKRVFRESTTISLEDVNITERDPRMKWSEFWELYSLPEEVMTRVPIIMEQIQKMYPLWNVSEVLSTEGFELIQDEIPELDQHTFISFLQYLKNNAENKVYERLPKPTKTQRWATLTEDELQEIEKEEKERARQEQKRLKEEQARTQLECPLPKILSPLYDTDEA